VKTLGVTGGIGSGKTTVCRMLVKRGAEVFHADEVGKRILQEDPDARRELVSDFGPEAYDADGVLDRAYVASRVFGDEQAVARINAIVHPRVHAAWAEAVREARSRGVRVLVLESALLARTGGAGRVDRILVVTAPEEARVRRVTGRDGSDPADVRSRMAHQASDFELRGVADYVIENTGTPEDLGREVDSVWRSLMEPALPDLSRWGNALTRWIGRAGLRAMRFRLVVDLPPLRKFVVIGAPHTTNWDFVVGMSMLFALGLRFHWIGKHTIFRPPVGFVLRALGGTPVDRRQPGDIVDQVVTRFRENDRFAVAISPEGTRSRTERWKSGFYRIAVAAEVPIVLAVLDFGRRELRLDTVFHPTGDYEADLPRIRAVFRPGQAKYPEKF